MTDPASLAPLLARYHQLVGDPAGTDERLRLAATFAAADGRATAWMQLAFECFSAFRFEAGQDALVRTLAVDPDFLPARWAQFQLPHCVAPRSAAEAEAYRQRWWRGLSEFEALDFRDPRWRSQVWGCVGQCTAFYLHYLGECTAEQRRYGALVHRMMAALDPGLEVRGRAARARPRVLFVSTYLHEHTVGRLFAPLVLGLDRARLDVHVLQLDPVDDAISRRLSAGTTLHPGPRQAPQWRQLIAQLAPDAIVYLDIGMHPMTQGLAALRLAPRQCVMWGHPVTTGLPTLDAFLSPEAMEPFAAEAHYTEHLLRLPGLGHGLDPPPAAPIPADLQRAPGSIELFCAQSVYKLLPEHDELFARILQRLPQARLHLIPHQDPHVRDWLQTRLARSCRPEQLVLHPMQSLSGFLGIAVACDLALDSLVWSGGMSSLDLLGAGLPVIALPGATMRSRQSAALLTRLDLPELIARDADDYVERAVALALDAPRRAAVREQLRARAARLYSDRDAVVAAIQDALLAR